MRPHRVILLLTAGVMLASLFHAGSASAGSKIPLDEIARRSQISGFISIRGGQLFEDDLVYVNMLDNRWSFSEESVVGLQLDTQMSDTVTTSLQVKNDNGAGKLELEWAYMEYAIDPDKKVRVGRLRAPGFMLSEFLDVGYAYPWVNVPEEVYGWLPFSRYEGADFRYWKSIGEADLRITPFAGTTSGQKLTLGNTEYTDQSSQFGGLDVQLSYDVFTFRAGYSNYRFEISNSSWDRFIDSAINGVTLTQGTGTSNYPAVKIPGFIDFVEDGYVAGALGEIITNPLLPSVAALLAETEQQSLTRQLEPYRQIPDMDGRYRGEFAGIGFSADNGHYLVMSELSRAVIGGVYPDVESGYVMVGYHFGAWMPHLTVSKMYTVDDEERPELHRLDFDSRVFALDPTGQLAAFAAQINQAADVFVSTTQLVRLEQTRVTAGVRWDATDGVAVKAELFRVNMQNGSYGYAFPATIAGIAGSQGAVSADAIPLVEPAPDHVDGAKLAVDVVF